MSDTPDYFRLVLRERPGVLCLAFGRRPYFDDTGAYRFRDWHEVRFRWPGELTELVTAIQQEMHSGEPVDVYVCPYVRHEGAKGRRKGDALPPMVCHADLDAEPKDQALYDTLNALTVWSGQDGHQHLYVPLLRPVGIAQHRALQVALRDRLGGDDKIADNDLLRWPGSWNHKPATAPNTGQPGQVRIRPGAPTVWDPLELAEMLGVELAQNSTGTSRTSTAHAEPADLDKLPAWLRKRLDDTTEPEDRSEAFHGLVGACKDAGLTQGQTVTVMGSWRPGVDKYGDRIADEVARCWPKLADARTFSRRTATVGADYCEHGNPADACRTCQDCEPVTYTAAPEEDLANARLFADYAAGRLRHVVLWRKWLVWDGTRWAPDETGEAMRCAKAVADTLPRKIGKRVARVQTRPGIEAMLALAATEPGIAVAPSQLDADPYLLNVANGTLDLRTGELRPHDRGDLLTKVTRAAYHPDARAPEFERFLERVQPDERMRDFLARLFGHALLGKVVEHLLPVFYGAGANGKTTLVEAVAGALGDYADTVDPGLLIDRGEVHPTGVADLFKLRLAVTHETDEGRRLAEGTVKRLTGGDRVKARRMRENFWTFEPSHSIIMHTNHKPIVRGTDEGIWRRLRFVPFSVIIPADERDLELPERLQLEADGILAWCVAGFRQWQDRGLDEPVEVVEATEEFRGESDMLALFLEERCMQNQFSHVRSSELFAAWQAWCKGEGIDAGTQTAFSRKLTERGFDKDHTRAGKVWRGIGLYADETTGGDGL